MRAKNTTKNNTVSGEEEEIHERVGKAVDMREQHKLGEASAMRR